MKKTIRLPLAAALAAFFSVGILSEGFSQKVSTQPQKKSVLLEEFTGSGCGNCPDGAAVAASIKEAAGENFHIIAIHAGHYAEPYGPNPDMRTDYGDSLLLECTDIGFPSGAINRYPYQGGSDPLNMNRGYWTKTVKGVLKEDAPVNLYLESSLDAKTRELKVRLEYCYTREVQETGHRLNVALIQNHISGYQNQAPAGYLHEHVLRDLLTGQWGEELAGMKKGEVYVKEYTRVLPDSIRNVPLDLRHVELVAFITRDRREVQNVTAAKPSISNLDDPVSVQLGTRDLGSTRYGFDFFPVSVRSAFNDTVRELEFSVEINGEVQTVRVEGLSLPPYQDGIFTVPVSTYEIQTNNEAVLRLQKINGEGYEGSGRQVSYSFTEPIADVSNKIFMEVMTDLCPDETKIRVRDREGNTVWEKGPFTDEGQVSFKDSVVFDKEGIYVLEFTDSWLDGWQEGAKGSYKIKDAAGKLIGQNYSVTKSLERIFVRVSEKASADGFSPVGELSLVRDGSGLRIANPSSRQIDRIRVFGIDGKSLYERPVNTRGDVRICLPESCPRLVIVQVVHEGRISTFKQVM